MTTAKARTTLTTALVFWCAFAAADPLNITNTPLSISGTVSPNVMLLVDDSMDMNSIMWADGFNRTKKYNEWYKRKATVGILDDGTTKSLNGPTIAYSEIADCNVGVNAGKPGWKLGDREGTAADAKLLKCLKLPDPVGTINPEGPLGPTLEATRYATNYLNYLFETYALDFVKYKVSGDEGNQDLTGGVIIPDDYRMNVARLAAADVISDTPGMRFGVSSLYEAPGQPVGQSYAHGASIDKTCGSPVADVTSTIQNYQATKSTTPIAEAFYEITRYFRGMTSYYRPNLTYTSPIQYRCQKNFTIVVSDGQATYDKTYPNDDPADVRDTSRSLPNWDKKNPDTGAAPPYPQYSDGHDPNDNVIDPDDKKRKASSALYLDDLAKFGTDIDLLTTGTDLGGGDFVDANIAANAALPFAKQNISTFTINVSDDNQMMRDAAEYGAGEYIPAESVDGSANLSKALKNAVSSIQGRTSSSSSVAESSGSISSNTIIYQARFSSLDWSGQLFALPIILDNTATVSINEDGFVGTALWDAGTKVGVSPTSSARKIFTYNPGVVPAAGAEFKWATLNAAQQVNLNTNSSGSADAKGSLRLNYLRGDAAGETCTPTPCTPFRKRPISKLGDIVNSTPQYVAAPEFRYKDNWGTGAPESASADTAYSKFRTDNKSRAAVVYVGANDGMLHAFNAAKTGGEELFAYVPNAVFPNLSKLTGENYNASHQFYVDGAPNVGDAFFGGVWHTVLVGGLNKGGQAVYALDVTAPATFEASKVLWEYTDNDLGYTFSQPSIVRMQNGVWAAIFGNGYNNSVDNDLDGSSTNDSTTGRAYLYIVNLATGALIRKIDTGVGDTATPNGLATPTPVDTNNDYIIDYVYAGDLRGNMWKFKVSGTDPSLWDVAYVAGTTKSPLFTACTAAACTDTNRQPITTRPEVASTQDGQLVLFGTGKYLEPNDVPNPPVTTAATRSFYGIFDKNVIDGYVAPTRTDLLQQSVLTEVTVTGVQMRVTSDNAVLSTHKGWYMDLPSSYEMQASNAVLRSGRVIFTTLIPTPDRCGYGGTSWLMELEAKDGSRLGYTPFDVNNDNYFSQADFVTFTDAQTGATTQVPVSGKKSAEGIISTPTVLAAGDKELKYNSGSTGAIERTVENPGKNNIGRQSWQQLQSE